MSPAIEVRFFSPQDEAAVRRICYDTALMGSSMRGFVDDERLVTEALLGYYLRSEPESMWVAIAEGRVIGYLSGCMNHARYVRAMATRIVPALVWRFVSAGLWRSAHARRLVSVSLRTAARWSGARRAWTRSFPAHCHVNVASTEQGRGAGRALLRRFQDAVAAAGVGGIHVSTETEAGRRFFASAGFERLASYRLPAFRAGDPPRESWLMGWKVPTIACPRRFAQRCGLALRSRRGRGESPDSQRLEKRR